MHHHLADRGQDNAEIVHDFRSTTLALPDKPEEHMPGSDVLAVELQGLP
jgi:hypothetical protein